MLKTGDRLYLFKLRLQVEYKPLSQNSSTTTKHNLLKAGL